MDLSLKVQLSASIQRGVSPIHNGTLKTFMQGTFIIYKNGKLSIFNE